MLENFRHRIVSFFDVPDQEQYSSVKLGRMLLWFAITGINCQYHWRHFSFYLSNQSWVVRVLPDFSIIRYSYS